MKKNKVIKATTITLSVLAVLAIGGSVFMGGYVADRILHQNEARIRKTTALSSSSCGVTTLRPLKISMRAAK